MDKLKNIFKKNSIHSGKDIIKKCYNFSLSEIYEFILSLYLEIEKNAYRSSEILTESVYLSTSAVGLSQFCSSPECRINRIQKTLKSSLLLSDRVFIDNPLERIANIEPSRDTSVLRSNYCSDLLYIYYIVSLLDMGVLINLPRWVTVCKHCKRQLTKSINETEKLILLKKKYFYELMKNEFTGSLKFDRDHWEVFYEGNLNLIPDAHPMVINMLKIPNKLKKLRNSRVTFNDFMKFGLPDNIIYDLISNAILYLPYKSRHGLNALVTNELEASIFNQLIMGKDNKKHEIPFINFDDINLGSLIKARHKQPEEFQNFRKEINKVIKEIRLGNGSQTNDKNSQLNVFIRQEISKNLNRLNAKINHYTGDQLKKALQRGLMVGSILGIGAYTGVLPNSAQILVSASLGILPHTAVGLLNRKDAIKNDNWYFYWQLAKK
ncbi:MAG: hypothetical protein PHT50_03145 [Candidatus Omnitrophica bacterium]|nr:hypothetical protein [Candidatus Omnitrophota bacterium]